MYRGLTSAQVKNLEKELMAASEERLKILNMIQEGILTPEEGLHLLDLLEKPVSAKSSDDRPSQPTPIPPRWLRVLITDTITGKTRINVRLPITVLNTGIKMGARFSTEIGQMEMGQVMDAIRSGSTGKVLDVIDEGDNEHIQILLE